MTQEPADSSQDSYDKDGKFIYGAFEDYADLDNGSAEFVKNADGTVSMTLNYWVENVDQTLEVTMSYDQYFELYGSWNLENTADVVMRKLTVMGLLEA